ncbi:MAG: aminotransferase class IV [Acidimicrobiales bacterium]
MRIVWLNGALVDEVDARISPFDHAVTTGDGVFETVRVVRGRPFAPTRHLARLEASASALGLPAPPPQTLSAAMQDLIDATAMTAGKLRITVTGGPAGLGSARGDGPTTVLVAAEEETVWPPTTDVAIVSWTRNENGALAGVKSISYADNVRALAAAQRVGASEALFANTRGELCEGTGTNVFCVLDGVLMTPPLSSGCLDGVTRRLVVEVADVTERAIPIGDLHRASEAFLTSTTRDVHPIRAVDDTVLAECPGPHTRAAAAAFAAVVAADLDP